jgi:carbonic anhydrase
MVPSLSRRALIRLLGLPLVAGAPAAALAAAPGRRRGHPLIDPDLVPDQADTPQTILQNLMTGNGRYARSEPVSHLRAVESRADLAAGQHPAVAVLGCADSRVGPELVFDQPRSVLFVCRVAGNTASDEVVGSLEYAVGVLGSKVIVVLGHTQCGAVKAAIELVEGKRTFPPAQFGQIGLLAERIAPAVRAVESTAPPGTLLSRATDAHAVLTAEALRARPPLLSSRVRDGALTVIPARYELETGRIVLL